MLNFVAGTALGVQIARQARPLQAWRTDIETGAVLWRVAR